MYPVPQQDRTSILRDYALVIVFVCFLAFFWVVFNEVVVRVGDVTLEMVGNTGTPATLVNFITQVYRIAPIGMVIGVFLWVFLRATKKEPYREYA